MRINRYTAAVIAALTLCAFSGCASDVPSEIPAETTAATTATATSVTTTTATTVATDDTESTSSDIPATEQTQATTNEPDIAQPLEPDETKPAAEDAVKPQEPTTSDDYTLADTDLVNSDGTYTQTAFDTTTIPLWVDESLAGDTEYLDYLKSSGKVSNPSKIPYSEITLENAHVAFPFLGWIGYKPNYTMVLSTDDAETIAQKVRSNLMGNEPTASHAQLGKYYNFTSEAEYNEYLAEQQAAKEDAERRGQEAQDANDRGAKIGGGDYTDEIMEDILNNLQGNN